MDWRDGAYFRDPPPVIINNPQHRRPRGRYSGYEDGRIDVDTRGAHGPGARRTHHHRRERSVNTYDYSDRNNKSDSNSVAFAQDQPGPLPSLTFHFDFGEDNSEKQQPSPASVKPSEQDGHQPAKDHSRKLYHENIFNVVRSQYAGGFHVPEASTIELITRHEQDALARDPPELLQWIQLERHYPSLRSFLDHVSHLNHLDEKARRDATLLIQHVRHVHEKSLQLPQGKSGKYLEPNVTSLSDITSESSSEGKQNAAFMLCMPYLCLAPYSDNYPSQASNFYPMRTLLQSSHMSTPKKRDLQQAVCGLGQSRKGCVFHVPQIWVLVLGNNAVVSCVHSLGGDSQRGLSGIKEYPASRAEDQPQLLVSDGGTRLWIFAVENCTTWLEFVANFRELGPGFESHYDVIYREIPQDASNWPSLIARARKTKVQELRLKFKMSYAARDLSDIDSSTGSDQSSDPISILRDQPPQSFSRSMDGLANANNGDSTVSQPHETREIHVPRNITNLVPGNKMSQQKSRTQRGSSRTSAPPGICPHVLLRFASVIEQPERSHHHQPHGTSSNHETDNSSSTRKGTNLVLDEGRLDDMMTDMHSFMCASRFMKHREYKRCPTATVDQVTAEPPREAEILPNKTGIESGIGESEGRYVFHDGRDSRDVDNVAEGYPDIRDERPISRSRSPKRIQKHRKHWGRRKTVRTLKTMFELFLPLNHSSEMVSKYWGALKDILQDDRKLDACHNALDSSRGIPIFSQTEGGDIWHCQRIINELTLFQGPLPQGVTLPKTFLEAWPHLVMFLVLSTANQHRGAFYELVKFRELAYGSRMDLMKSLAPESLHRKEAVLSLGITSMLVKDVLRDITLGLPNITATYSEHLEKLRQEVVSDPYSREHQEKILRFRQEIDCTSKVLQDQSYCVDQVLDRVGKGATHAPWPFQRERESYILQDCLSAIEAKTRRFADMSEDAAQLSSWVSTVSATLCYAIVQGVLAKADVGQNVGLRPEVNISRIESNKDRHEAAILVFTTVTVVFLPLSFVSSLFGMNTADIRDMDTRQWIFWVTALPVTIIVIVFALFAIRYFESARQTFGRYVYRNALEEPNVVKPQQVQIQNSMLPEQFGGHGNDRAHFRSGERPLYYQDQNGLPMPQRHGRSRLPTDERQFYAGDHQVYAGRNDFPMKPLPDRNYQSRHRHAPDVRHVPYD